jgi:hypothetical protein
MRAGECRVSGARLTEPALLRCFDDDRRRRDEDILSDPGASAAVGKNQWRLPLIPMIYKARDL